RLYPESFPDSGYLGTSAYFGFYPQSWNQDQFLNISRHHVPQGFEVGTQWFGTDAAVAFGDELSWGVKDAVYGRLSLPIAKSKITVVGKTENPPEDIYNGTEKRDAYSLSWDVPFEAGHRFDIGVLYQPYRSGERYLVEDDAAA